MGEWVDRRIGTSQHSTLRRARRLEGQGNFVAVVILHTQPPMVHALAQETTGRHGRGEDMQAGTGKVDHDLLLPCLGAAYAHDGALGQLPEDLFVVRSFLLGL